MRPVTILASILVAASAAAGTLAMQESKTPPVPASAGPASLDTLGFLAGSWTGDMSGSYVEETWSRPQGTSIIGSFRWLKKDGTPSMFEMLAITREDDAVRLRLRHYSGKLIAKEDADKPLTLKLTESSATRAVFEAEKDAGDLERIVYAVESGVLAIDVEFKPEEGKSARDALKFRLKRGS